MTNKYLISIIVSSSFALVVGSLVVVKNHASTTSKTAIPKSGEQKIEKDITLEVYQPPVYIINPGREEVQARGGETLTEGSRVRTGETGQAQIVFPKGTVTRINGNSDVQIAKFNPAEYQIAIRVDKGRIWSSTIQLKGESVYTTISKNIRTIVKSASYGHYVNDQGDDVVISSKGEVVVKCLNGTESGRVIYNSQATFTCQYEQTVPAEVLHVIDRDDAWYRFNANEDNKQLQRFGKDAFELQVLGASTSRELTPTVIPTPTLTLTPSPTRTPTPMRVNTPTPTPTVLPSLTPTRAASASATITPVREPRAGITLDSDRHNVTITLLNFKGYKSFKYELVYDSDQGVQGFMGEQDTEDGDYATTKPLGTCSAGGACVYQTNVKDIKLTVDLLNDADEVTKTLEVTTLGTIPSITPTSELTLTPSPTITETPIPSNTPIPITPTGTPDPTATPTNTPTPTLIPTIIVTPVTTGLSAMSLSLVTNPYVCRAF